MNTAPELATAQLLSCAEDIRKTFPKPDGGELLVLDGVNLTLSAGQIVGLLGRSGSGKSTLLRLIAGLAEPSAGTLAFRGEPIAGRPPASRWCSRASRCSRGSRYSRTSPSDSRRSIWRRRRSASARWPRST